MIKEQSPLIEVPLLPDAADLITSRVAPKKISDISTDKVVNKNNIV
ncbi:43000_t:CDS:1, partial [Gigaspora margarita]